MKEKVLYRIMFCCWYAVSKLPACVHYFNSLWLSALLFHVIRYRRKLVHRQMKDSFPGSPTRNCGSWNAGSTSISVTSSRSR